MRSVVPLLHAAAALALLGAPALAAQGIIVPGPCRDCAPWTPGRPAGLPVESVSFETTIEGQVATTRVTQVFRNPYGTVMEGTYFFPLPEDASIGEFAIWEGDRRLAGEVRHRAEARRVYEDIVRRIQDPGLLEYAGPNLFQARIFPIPARGTKRLELVYTQVLRAESGTVGYRYPLGIGRNASPVERLSGRVTVRTSGRLGTVYSPSHDIDLNRDGERRASASFEQGRAGERRDFQLFYALSDADVALSLFTYRAPGEDGYFLLLLSPQDAARAEPPARDVVFVLDVSGSMSDEGKMEGARGALLHGIRTLRPADRFNVIAFSGDTRRMEAGLIAADAGGRRRGVAFVEGLRPNGGTNIHDALVEAMEQFPRASGRPRMLVFLTDGLPTVGETNVERILEDVAGARRPEVRLFSFGVGYDVNTRLLDRVAAENGGTADYVAPDENLEVRVSTFFDKVNHPVLANLRLELPGLRTDQVYPRELPDLFRGTQLALVGRYRNAAELRGVTARLTGSASPARTFTFPGLRFPLRDERHDFLPRLWATRRVGSLMEQIRSHGESRELVEEVTDLGTRFGIVTPYTSFLAVEPGAGSGGGRPPVVIRGSSRPGAPPPAPQLRREAATATTGAVAVEESRRTRAQQDALTLEGVVVAGGGYGEGVQRVGPRTFHLRDGAWTDAEIGRGRPLPETVVAFGSEEYHALLRRVPALARYFALGERVAVVHEGRVYRVR
jgi:Ca-activated chloride channel family protein